MQFRSFYNIFLENRKISVRLKDINELSEENIRNSYKNLSEIEINQLHLGRDAGYVSYEEWPILRDYMLQKSLASNPLTNPDLCAYTPGETMKLLDHPIVKEYHNSIKNFSIGEEYNTIILVPCAKTKPWLDCTKGSLYPSYNKIKNEYSNVYFVTISEPLAIVPQSLWGSFPQYDNPGLFKDPVMRSGLFTKDWKILFGAEKQMKTPFDSNSYSYCINRLASVIKQFFKNNPNKKIISFLEDFSGKGTHSEMIDFANVVKPENRFLKREKPRTLPYSYIKGKLQ